ncbi:MAG: cell division protein MukB, partial [Eubacterium sp.]|nr:cell division protein MukB [Eubacterium sp.]
REVIEELFEKLALDDENSSGALEDYTDYRTYMDYDIKITADDGSYMLYSKVSREKSGGETQTPFYITVAASFMQLYRNSIGGDSIGLIMMDEAFNNMDDEHIRGVLSFMRSTDLQLIISAPPEKIQYIGPSMDKVLLVLADGGQSYVDDFTHEVSV